MILPTIAAVAEDALRAVPSAYREGAAALGATPWQAVRRVLLPAARSGLTTAVVLGLGRALGETMAVLMVTGNSASLPNSLLDPIRTLTGNIALEMAYATGAHRQALFATGALLLGLVLLVNQLARRGGRP
jgi:phosphate transport system permease protein